MVMTMSRRTMAIMVAAAVAVSVLATWIASARVRSPAEIAARTAPPQPSAILASVQTRELASKVVSRGTGRYGSPVTVTVNRSSLKRGRPIVTSLAGTGATVQEADIVATVSGRPVFVLAGAQPSYRDLGPGMSGVDVKQLEAALKRAGLPTGTVDGVYDGATENAVTALYRRHHLQPLRATGAQLGSLLPVESGLIDGGRPRGGVQLPADEVAFVPAVPVRVAKRVAAVGSVLGRELLTVTDSVVSVDGTLPTEDAALVKVGTRVKVDEPALGVAATGRISMIAPGPGTGGADAVHVAFRVVVDDPPPAVVGASVRVTIPVGSPSAAQLTVPVSAVSLAADGSSRLQRSVDGKLEVVPVTTGLAADGFVVVTPVGGNLVAGDLVVIGLDLAAGVSGG
jgi:peptidoglycan hydrolase-like protein with peptidoglycan-binding domain